MKKAVKIISFAALLFTSTFFIILPQSAEAAVPVDRIDGKDRFEVAAGISKRGWPEGADTVILANYQAYADALTATPLAYLNNAPILLTQSYKLTDAAKAEIQRLKPGKVIVIGGTGSVSEIVIEQLRSMGISKVIRIGGKDRFEVAKNIARQLPPTDMAVFAYGLNFPDALAIAPFAARQGYPILLTNKKVIPEATMSSLRERNVRKSMIVGGEGSVGVEVYNKLPSPQRIGGKDRFEVAKNVSEELHPEAEKVFLATGMTFADALTGSVLAAKEEASLLLTLPYKVPHSVKESIVEREITNALILGGTGSVNEGIVYLPGNWELETWGGYGLQGYASATSVEAGKPITFYINSSSGYHLEFYRMGYYGGKGAELKETVTGFDGHIQEAVKDPETLAANWQPSVTFTIPPDWETGTYLVKIVTDENKSSYMHFVVRETNPQADFLVLISTNTYQAYNNWGGKSLYTYNSWYNEAAMKVSFARPYTTRWGSGEFFVYEYNLIRWLEKNGYSLTYVTDTDLHKGILERARVNGLVISGHNEYWSKEMRDQVEADKTLNIGVFSANVGYWQVRYEDDFRTMVGYKANAAKDPYQTIDPSRVTTRFRDAPVNRPEENLFGSMYRGIPQKTMPLVVTDESHWIYEGTGLKNGDKIEGVVGGEIDRSDFTENIDHIARSPVVVYGKPTVADVAWYRHPEGRKVFSVGTFYWNWFLDPYGHETKSTYNEKIDIMTANVMEVLKRRQ